MKTKDVTNETLLKQEMLLAIKQYSGAEHHAENT